MRLPPWQRQIDALQQVQRGKRGRESFQAPLLSFYFKGPTSYKSRTEDKSPKPNLRLRSVLGFSYVFCLTIFSLPVFSSNCFLRIRFRWIQMRGAPTSTDDRRKFPLLRFPDAIVFPSIYLFRIWLQIGPDARNNAKQADDVVQDLGTSRKPAAFDNADGPIWTVGEKGFLHHPKKFQEVARPTKAFFRASLT